MKESIEKAIQQTLNADDLEARASAFMTVFDNAYQSDEEVWKRKGFHLLRAFLGGKDGAFEILDDVLITLTGYSLETLMRQAHLIPSEDDDEMVAIYKTEYINGDEEFATVKVNPKTLQILDWTDDAPFSKDAAKRPDEDAEIIHEGIYFPDVEETFDVIPKDQKDADNDVIHFWYDETF